VIALGVATAGSADPRIGLLVALAAFGAFLGDNTAYLLGRRFGSAVDRRLFARERGAQRRGWAERSLDRLGMLIIIACRFIPGGRTAVTLTCGLIGYPRGRFVIATAVAGIVWAGYAFFLGRLGGKAFEHQPWIGLLLALGLALAVSVLIDAARRVLRWFITARNRTKQVAADLVLPVQRVGHVVEGCRQVLQFAQRRDVARPGDAVTAGHGPGRRDERRDRPGDPPRHWQARR
jgi:membrane-associated protein